MTEITTTPSTKEEPSKRLKESEWLVISSLWERGETTLKELSEKFKISEAALSQGLKRRGIKRGAKAHVIAKAVEAKSQEEAAKLIEEIYQFKKRMLRYGDFFMTSTVNLITEAKRDGKPLAVIRNDLESIVSATKVYKTIRNDMFHLYDLYNPDNKPDENLDFNIGVYSKDDIEKIREAQEIEKQIYGDEEDDDPDNYVMEGLEEEGQ